MKRTLAIGTMLALMASPLAWVAPAATASTESVGELLIRNQLQSAVPLMAYCALQVPALKAPTAVEYQRFKDKFKKASTGFAKQIAASPELAKPATPELKNTLQGVDAQMLAEIQRLDSKTYCAQLKANLAGATAASIRTNLQAALARFAAMSSHNGQSTTR